MDLSAIIIGLAILGLFLFPVILISRSGKKKMKRLSDEIMTEASKNELTISENDSWNESAIGMDVKNDKIIFIDESHSEKVVRLINLKDVKSFSTSPDLTKGNSRNTDYEKEPRLSLNFIFKDPSKSETNITFYIAGFGKLTKTEQHLFEKWSGIIGKRFGL